MAASSDMIILIAGGKHVRSVILGLDPAPFAALPVVGEDMAFIDDDEFDEVGITAGLARQRFLFNVHRCLLVEEEDGGEEDAGRGGGAAGGGRPAINFEQLVHGQIRFARDDTAGRF